MINLSEVRMPKSAVVGVALCALVGLTACGGGSGEFCQISREASDVEPTSPRALEFLNRAVDSAPDEVRSDVVTLRDAVRTIQQADNPRQQILNRRNEIQTAAESLSSWTAENCSAQG